MEIINRKQNILEITDLKAGYFDREILSGITLKVSCGEIVTLLGANGSGKSTLLKALAGIVPILSGRAQYGEHDLAAVKPHEIRQLGIGTVLQGGKIFPSLTVREHFYLAAETVNKNGKACEIEIIQNVFPSLSSVKKRAGLLSGGERQMLAFSMLLIQEASLWLLDEPCSGLAEETATELTSLIRETCKRRNISVLLIEQNLKQGLRIADSVCVLKNGVIDREKRTSPLMSNYGIEDDFLYLK